MKDDEKDIDLIEAYLKGELTGTALQEFELRRTSDASFDSDVNDYLLIMKETAASGQRSFIEKVKGWEHEIASQEKGRRLIPQRHVLSIAATVLVVALAGSYMIFKSLPPTNDELFAQYFQPYKDVVSQRSADPGPFQAGMNFYNEGKYAEAITPLKKAMNEDPNNLSIQCYLGIAYLGAHEMREAKKILEPIATSPPGLYREIAEWNLALAYLKAHEISQLRKQLDIITQQKDHIFFKQAMSLSEEFKAE